MSKSRNEENLFPTVSRRMSLSLFAGKYEWTGSFINEINVVILPVIIRKY